MFQVERIETIEEHEHDASRILWHWRAVTVLPSIRREVVA